MKALFVIHCQDPIYGASRSVGNLIRNLDADVDIIFPFKIKKDGITAAQIDKYYGPRVKNVWFLPQPERLTALVGRVPIKKQLKSFVKEILYRLAKPEYEKIYKRGRYDFIHLNSATLFPMLTDRWPMFLHVRETFRSQLSFWNRGAAQKMNQAKGIIFIDPNSRKAAPDTSAPSLVLINPFDQRAVGAVDLKQAQRRFGLTNGETVYGIIGNVTRDKGVDKAIQAFQKAILPDSVFLVVGSMESKATDQRFVTWIKAAADMDPRIRLIGEVEDIEAVYRVLDYVVRCDPAVGLGRTVYEALYSGCGVILQNDGSLQRTLPNTTTEMEGKVFFYEIGSTDSLIDAFRRTRGERVKNRVYYSNVDRYVKQFQAFIAENAGGTGNP